MSYKLYEVLGFKIYLDDNGGHVTQNRSNGVYEPDKSAYIQNNLKRGMRFVDVGANVGYFTMMAASLVEDTGSVIAFEPNRANILNLEKSMVSNGFKCIEAYQIAISNTFGFKPFYVYESDGLHCLDRRDREPKEEVDVYVSTLNNMALPYPIDMLKIDVEGHELAVLQGADEVLRSTECVLMDLHPMLGADTFQVCELLIDSGFRLYTMQEKPLVDYENIREVLAIK